MSFTNNSGKDKKIAIGNNPKIKKKVEKSLADGSPKGSPSFKERSTKDEELLRDPSTSIDHIKTNKKKTSETSLKDLSPIGEISKIRRSKSDRDREEDDSLSNPSVENKGYTQLAHTLSQNTIDSIYAKNFGIEELETMHQKLTQFQSTNEFRNSLFVGDARSMLETLMGERWIEKDSIDHENFFDLLKNKIRAKIGGQSQRSLQALKEEIRKLRIPENLNDFNVVTDWAFQIRKILKKYPQETLELLDVVFEDSKTHFMHVMYSMYPKERQSVHEGLRELWKRNTPYNDLLNLVVKYSEAASTRLQACLNDGLNSDKKIGKRKFEDSEDDVPFNRTSSSHHKQTAKERRAEYWRSKQQNSLNSISKDDSGKRPSNRGYPKGSNPGQRSTSERVRPKPPYVKRPKHNGCGLGHPLDQPCLYENHPSYNKEDVPFAQSEVGKRYIAVTGKFNLSDKGAYVQDDPFKTKPRRVSTSNLINPLIHQNNHKTLNLPFFEIDVGDQTWRPRVLIDTGCFSRSYISEEFLQEINQYNQIIVNDNIEFSVCSCLGNCISCNSHIILKIKYIEYDKTFTFELKFFILPSTIPIIIGHPHYVQFELDIKCKKFIKIMHKQFVNDEVNTLMYEVGEIIPKEKLLDIVQDDDLLPEKSTPWKNFLETSQDGENQLPLLSQIEGNENQQKPTMLIIEKHKHVFSRSLPSTPAKVTPMRLRVDSKEWKHRRNQIRPRPLSLQREKQSRLQIEELLKIQVIEPSEAAFCSAVHMVPKPNSKELRFTVDFRNLNEATEADRLHLPNIKVMLQALGETRPKYFGKLDLTKGYYQMPMDENSKIWTAFTSHAGTFQWKRVPMGLKGAAGWFQKMLTTECLRELMHSGKILLYIDDLIISGATFEEYLENLDKVLTRLDEFGFVVHPGKCQFNTQEIEYVGHTLNSTGIKFSKEKIKKVIDFKIPTTHQEMRSFLGLANWFRDNVRNYSSVSHVLHEGIKDYHRKKPYEWDDERRKAFHSLKQMISDAPMLFFPEKEMPIFLHTDASNYGIGAFLFQEDKGIRRPIAFMSAKLNETQQNWSTLEKECYAIVQALHKFDYLLMDVPFTIRTDHRNLTFLNQGLSTKVLRWKLMIQEYDFVIEHIAGENNTQADAFSRANFNSLQLATYTLTNLANLVTGKYPTTIPEDIRLIIESYHNDFYGHHGIERTLEVITQRFKSLTAEGRAVPADINEFPQYCRQFVNSCVKCQLFKQLKPIIQARKYTCASYKPMRDIAIDTIGPLPMDPGGNTHILVIIDTFSRWMQLTAIPDVSAITAARHIVSYIGTFGNPETIRHDQGTQFNNELWKELFRLAGIKQIINNAYSKEENGIVERANKEVNKHLRNFMFGNPDIKAAWSLITPLIQRIYNNSPNKHIGNIRPCQIIFGNSIDLDGPLLSTNENSFQDIESKVSNTEYKSYLTFLLKNQQAIIQEALQSQLIHDNIHLNKHTPEKVTNYAVGSYVLVDRYPPHTDWSRKGKLNTRWLGPYLVIKHQDDWYTLKNLVTNNEEVFHVKQIKPFLYDTNRVDPVKIAHKHSDEYIVDTIISHQGDLNKIDTVKFQVRWKDFTALDDTFEPWEHLKMNHKLHEYLISINKANLIPTQFRANYPSQFAQKKRTKVANSTRIIP